MARHKRDFTSQKRGVSELQRASGVASSTKRHCYEVTKASTRLYAPKDAVLVVGDGDFSFSRGLVKHRGTGQGVLATSFDSESEVKRKYSNAKDCIAAVRLSHGLVVHDVDGTKLLGLPRQVKTGTGFKTIPDFFQFIVFNFPHTGEQRVHVNRALLRDFFESARNRLTAHGEAHVTLKTRPPYSNWFIEDQAKTAGFVMKQRRKFEMSLFPGYRHRTTDPQAKKFEPHLCVTYVFVVNRSKYPFVTSQAASVVACASKVATQGSEQHNLAAAIIDIAASKKARRPVRHVVESKSDSAETASKDSILTKWTLELLGYGKIWKPLHR